MGRAAILVILGGVLFGSGFGGLVHDAVTHLNGQAADGEGRYGAVMGIGLALMLIASWSRDRP